MSRRWMFAGYLALTFLVVACGAAPVTPAPSPSIVPTIAPLETPTSLPVGPLTGTGPLARGTYESPPEFSPAFLFDLRSDAWVSVMSPDAFGFVLATPNLVRAHAFIALRRPESATVGAFEQELASHAFLAASGSDPAAVVTDLSVGGVPSRMFVSSRSIAVDAFSLLGATGSHLTALGGPLSENTFVYVPATAGPIVLILSRDSEGAAEVRFAFDAMLKSIAFK
ncbi:MAG: hypothetical protein ABI573_10340 [Chloroflexota bacterium]